MLLSSRDEVKCFGCTRSLSGQSSNYRLTDGIRDAIFVGAGNAFVKESRTVS